MCVRARGNFSVGNIAVRESCRKACDGMHVACDGLRVACDSLRLTCDGVRVTCGMCVECDGLHVACDGMHVARNGIRLACDGIRVACTQRCTTMSMRIRSYGSEKFTIYCQYSIEDDLCTA